LPDQCRGHPSSIYYTLCAIIFGKISFLTFQAEQLKKKSHNHPGFSQQALVCVGLLEYGLKFSENCLQQKKTAIKMAIKMAAEKINLQANLSSIKRKFRIFTSCSLKLMIKKSTFFTQ
jgi:hypothetical protein